MTFTTLLGDSIIDNKVECTNTGFLKYIKKTIIGITAILIKVRKLDKFIYNLYVN